MRFAGCWVALEDVKPGSGELEYYPGSHKFEEFLWNGRNKLMPPDDPDHAKYLEQLHTQAKAHGCERKRFNPRKGDALLWAADLAHGGALQTTPGLTRRSLVTHMCPEEDKPQYFLETERRERLQDACGAYYSYPFRWAEDVGGAITEDGGDRNFKPR
jgi:ectoine hydroxylase-related dioxygenase (phytanoyl-CoA dioxygenase family)